MEPEKRLEDKLREGLTQLINWTSRLRLQFGGEHEDIQQATANFEASWLPRLQEAEHEAVRGSQTTAAAVVEAAGQIKRDETIQRDNTAMRQMTREEQVHYWNSEHSGQISTFEKIAVEKRMAQAMQASVQEIRERYAAIKAEMERIIEAIEHGQTPEFHVLREQHDAQLDNVLDARQKTDKSFDELMQQLERHRSRGRER